MGCSNRMSWYTRRGCSAGSGRMPPDVEDVPHAVVCAHVLCGQTTFVCRRCTSVPPPAVLVRNTDDMHEYMASHQQRWYGVHYSMIRNRETENAFLLRTGLLYFSKEVFDFVETPWVWTAIIRPWPSRLCPERHGDFPVCASSYAW